MKHSNKNLCFAMLSLVVLISACASTGALECTKPQLEQYARSMLTAVIDGWSVPKNAEGDSCHISLVQDADGTIVKFEVDSCTMENGVQDSIAAAIESASPLPRPENPACFAPSVTLEIDYRRTSSLTTR